MVKFSMLGSDFKNLYSNRKRILGVRKAQRKFQYARITVEPYWVISVRLYNEFMITDHKYNVRWMSEQPAVGTVMWMYFPETIPNKYKSVDITVTDDQCEYSFDGDIHPLIVEAFNTYGKDSFDATIQNQTDEADGYDFVCRVDREFLITLLQNSKDSYVDIHSKPNKMVVIRDASDTARSYLCPIYRLTKD